MAGPPHRRRPAGKPARAYHHGDLKRALVDATLALVAERGPKGFTLTEAARRAGVSTAAAYRHFADKEALLASAAAEGFDHFRVELQRVAESEGGRSLAGLERLAVTYVQLAADDPARYQVMFGAGLDKAAHPALLEAGQASFHAWAGAVAAVQQAGALPAEDPLAFAFSGWALVHGIASLLSSGSLGPIGETTTAESLTSQGILTLLAGASRPSPAPTSPSAEPGYDDANPNT